MIPLVTARAIDHRRSTTTCVPFQAGFPVSNDLLRSGIHHGYQTIRNRNGSVSNDQFNRESPSPIDRNAPFHSIYLSIVKFVCGRGVAGGGGDKT